MKKCSIGNAWTPLVGFEDECNQDKDMDLDLVIDDVCYGPVFHQVIHVWCIKYIYLMDSGWKPSNECIHQGHWVQDIMVWLKGTKVKQTLKHQDYVDECTKYDLRWSSCQENIWPKCT
jgi:hypothetical protein